MGKAFRPSASIVVENWDSVFHLSPAAKATRISELAKRARLHLPLFEEKRTGENTREE
jgi:hypothetical protein